MTYPTPEEIADECGATRYVVGTVEFTREQFQAFATRMIEIGKKIGEERSANICDELPADANAICCAKAIRNNTGEWNMKLPQLNDGEVYAGALVKPDGTGHHIILLPGDNDDADWQTQMDWAKSIGGDLPSRPELAHLYAHLKQEFKEAWYWSNEQHESNSVNAWLQYFGIGYQVWDYKNCKLRARAVRRSAI